MATKDENRRAKSWLWCPAEKAISKAIQEVEKMGVDEKLTQAVNNLIKAQNAVADYFERNN